MNSNHAPFRSPLLMNADDSALVVIDVQEKLFPLIQGNQQIEWNILRLLECAKTLGVEVGATEQYPKGLGKTIPTIAKSLEEKSKRDVPSKIMFSCRQCSELFISLADAGIQNLLLCGAETHVCVMQSALDLMSQGFNVFVCVDAVGSRSNQDHDFGIRRMEGAGATMTTTEAAMFEWCVQAGSEQFKTVSKLVQQSAPRSD